MNLHISPIISVTVKGRGKWCNISDDVLELTILTPPSPNLPSSPLFWHTIAIKPWTFFYLESVHLCSVFYYMSKYDVPLKLWSYFHKRVNCCPYSLILSTILWGALDVFWSYLRQTVYRDLCHYKMRLMAREIVFVQQELKQWNMGHWNEWKTLDTN